MVTHTIGLNSAGEVFSVCLVLKPSLMQAYRMSISC